jgi:hypothetical protein
MEDYVEPTRMGTPRGMPIGFSREKYAATLLILAEHKGQKQIADFLKISHELLRKWKTESDFKKQVEEHKREFAALFKEYVTNFLRNPNSDISFKQVREEANSFAPQLSIESLVVLEEIIEEGSFSPIYLCELVEVFVDSALRDPRLRSDTSVMRSRMSQKMMEVLRTKYIDNVIAVLSEQRISEKDKENCIRLLRTLRECTRLRTSWIWLSLALDQGSSTQDETEANVSRDGDTETD